MKIIVLLFAVLATTYAQLDIIDKDIVKRSDEFVTFKDEVKWNEVKPNDINKEPLINTPLPGSSREGKGRITFGTPVNSLANFGFQIGILVGSSKKPGQFWCGGSIISNEYAVTAAHCLHEATSGLVYFGCSDRTVAKGDCHTVAVSFADYIVHEAYDPVATSNDIALIKFPQKIKFTANIYAIPLNKNPNINSGADCIISGWGQNENGQQPNILAFANVKTIAESECNNYFRTGSSQICQGVSKAVGVCQGDSGGPMTMNVGGKPALIGLTSFGPKDGCVNNFPRVFTRISFFMPWISKQTQIF